MSKIKLQYRTSTLKDPKTKEVIADKRSAHIVNIRNYTLDEVASFALSNNYIEGCKAELAKGILKGAIEAERALLLAGNSVTIDGWVKYEPRLKGSVPADKRTLSAKNNSLIVGISALKELKLPLDTFSWQLVDEGFKPDPGPTPVEPPVITRYECDGMEGEPISMSGITVAVFGTNMAEATDIEFCYTRTGEAFYTMGVADSTEDSASGTTEWGHVPTAENGFIRVVGPGGTSEAFPCTFVV